jgi:hypothetical protein
MEPVSLFKTLETGLAQHSPEMMDLARTLGDRVKNPSCTGPEDCWRLIWDKPLYANTRASGAERKIEHMEPPLVGAWRRMGQPGGDFWIEKHGKGTSVTSFSVSGAFAEQVRRNFRVAPHRLFAIQGGARALRRRVETVNAQAPYADLVPLSCAARIGTVLDEMGPHWGHITALHFMTDIGLACKPDLHLVRTIKYLGLAPGMSDKKVPNLRESIEINERVAELCVALYGAFTSKNFRYLDKALMEISRQKIIELHQAGTL